VLTQVNLWLDAIFTSLYPVVLIVFGVHLTFNFIKKRMHNRFVLGQWPHHEGPPVPALPKFLHFQHVACMFLLGFSGMYIRFPFFNGGRTFMRYVHYVAMIVVVVNLVWRLWYAFGSRRRDYREFAITRMDIVTAPKVILYYIFVKDSKPHLGKYNVMQKGTYTLFVPLMIIQAFTGFALIQNAIPLIGASPRGLLLGWWLAPLVGGLAVAGAWARIAHYAINWLFIILTTVHAYLSVTEDFPAFQDFFGLGGPHAEGHGDHGHGEEHSAEPAVVLADADAVPAVD